jgi:hypothetical protein
MPVLWSPPIPPPPNMAGIYSLLYIPVTVLKAKLSSLPALHKLSQVSRLFHCFPQPLLHTGNRVIFTCITACHSCLKPISDVPNVTPVTSQQGMHVSCDPCLSSKLLYTLAFTSCTPSKPALFLCCSYNYNIKPKT